MSFTTYIEKLSTPVLVIPTISILICAFLITLKTRFVQFRAIKQMFKSLFSSVASRGKVKEGETILAHKALFTAMSTTIGTATIVAPVAAIKLGGPGALLFFLVTSLLGGAVSFAEVTFAVSYRKKLPDGTIMGGPMQYIKEALPKIFSSVYAFFAVLLLLIWTALQANTLADTLVTYYVPNWLTGVLLSVLVTWVLVGGIKQIGNISEKIVPLMFFLYTAAGLYIVLSNYDKLAEVFDLMFRSAITPQAILGGSVYGGLIQALRWGFIRGIASNEAGIGTTTIPHSMTEAKDPVTQGLLSVVGIYAQGFLCLLSGLIVLLTGTWQDPSIRFGISAVTTSFSMYFSIWGPIILSVSATLFAFGTVLGNGYNTSQCYTYLTHNRYKAVFLGINAIIIFLGTIAPVRLMWVLPDFFLVMVALPNIIAILILSYKRKDLLKLK